MGLSSSVKISLAILALVLVYFGVHSLFGSETTVDEEVIGPVLFHVIAEEVQSEPRQDVVKIRGRSEAARKVTVRAETPGMIEATPTKPGTYVKKGDVLCQLREDARRANLNEARAAQKRAKLDYDAAARLAEEGFRAETSLAAVRAALDL
ncbi:MAG: biotin/lipoyl-binding protein, partial [Parvularculaceae bacterium]